FRRYVHRAQIDGAAALPVVAHARMTSTSSSGAGNHEDHVEAQVEIPSRRGMLRGGDHPDRSTHTYALARPRRRAESSEATGGTIQRLLRLERRQYRER